MAGQTEYMDLNTFLEKWFSTDKDYDRRIIADLLVEQWNTMYNRRNSIGVNSWKVDPYLLKDFQDIHDNLYTEQGKEIMVQFINAMKDTSPEATDFLKMLENLTPFYAREKIPDSLIDQYAQMQVNIISRGKVKDPKHAYMLLDKIQQNNRVTNKIFLDALHLKVMNPNATLDDLYTYATCIANHPESQFYAVAPTELMSMLNDQMVKVDTQITSELDKDVPNMDNIKNLRTGKLLKIADAVYLIMSRERYPKEQLDEMSELKKLLASKYDMTKILDVEQGNYVQQFETQASLALSQAQSEAESAARTKSDLEAAQGEIKGYQSKIEELQHENKTLKEERTRFLKLLDMKLGIIKTYFLSFNRIKKQLLNRGKDLTEIGEGLESALTETDPKTQYNWMKDMEDEIAKMKKQQMEARGRQGI